VHADQRAADVKSGVGVYLFERHGMAERFVRGRRKRAARLGLRQDVDDLAVRHSLVLHDQRAVQMLAALGGKIHAHGRKYAGEPSEDGVRHLRRRPAADLMAHARARAAADDDDLSAAQMCDLRKLARRLCRLLLRLFHQTMIFYLMYDSRHDLTPL